MSMKEWINKALKAENLKLKSRVDSLEKITQLDISRNKLDQYTRRNSIEIQGIPATVSDDHLEDKVLCKDICKAMNLTVENSDIEGCHRTGRGDPKTTTVRFVNRKSRNLIPDKNNVFEIMRHYFLVRTCYPLIKSLLGNAGSWEELVKFTVPSALKVLWRFDAQWMSDLFLLNMTDLTSIYLDFVFKEKQLMRRAVIEVLSSRSNISNLKFVRLFL